MPILYRICNFVLVHGQMIIDLIAKLVAIL